MTTQEVANRLVELCKTGAWDKAQEELYSQDCESIEPAGMPHPHVKGMEAIKKKGEMFNSMVEEMYGASVSEPMIAGDFFTLTMEMDVKYKDRPRSKDSEICVYEVKDGKIVKEQFFYAVPEMG